MATIGAILDFKRALAARQMPFAIGGEDADLFEPAFGPLLPPAFLDLSGAWTSVPYASITFSSNAGTWTVASVAYYKYRIIGNVLFVKGAIVGSTTASCGTELRITLPAGVALHGNDNFGFTVYSTDGFTTQDCGQSICRQANNWIAFKQRVGVAWPDSVANLAVIWNLVSEL